MLVYVEGFSYVEVVVICDVFIGIIMSRLVCVCKVFLKMIDDGIKRVV